MKSRGVVIWVGGFVGVLLLYTAYRSTNQKLTSPWSVLSQGLGNSAAAVQSPPPVAAPNAQLSPSSMIGSQVGSGMGVIVPAAYNSSPSTYLPRTVTDV